jgi:predicted anti-sigma-YlaC factor YlaD
MSMQEPGTPSSPPPKGPSEIECRQIAELLADSLDGSLPKHTVELIEWHIDGCPPCVAFMNTYRGTIRATGSLREVQVPAELKSRLLAVLRATKSEGTRP